MRATSKRTVQKARRLRKEMSRPEARLWQVLRERPSSLKFRRQHPIGPYVLDFYCPSAKLGIEVDGNAHEMGDRPLHDQARDKWLTAIGLRILRIPAEQLYGDITDAVQHILNMCESRSSLVQVDENSR